MRGLIVGVDNIKLAIVKALAIPEPGPNYIHLPAHLDAEFFDQLASERLEVKYTRGFPKHVWQKDPNTRNEAFDTIVYASAAASLVTKPAKSITDKIEEPSIADAVARLHARSNGPTQELNSNGHST